MIPGIVKITGQKPEMVAANGWQREEWVTVV